MKLADKLDRLRGRDAPLAAGGSMASGTQAPAVAAALGDVLARLRRQQGPVSRQPRSPAAPANADERLASVLDAVETAPGVLLTRDRVVIDPVRDDRLAALPECRGIGRPDWVYLDTETTGLAGGVGTLAFMVGLARYRDGHELALRQYTLTRFSAEAEMLRQVVEWLGNDAILVSYNGKRFDWPLLQARLALCRIKPVAKPAGHLDLMYAVRRAYGRFWPDCRLQTAERCLLGLHRQDDLPGHEAPAAWRRWLQRGDAGALPGVLRHNALDVASLARLHGILAADHAGGCRDAVDYAAIGRAWFASGDTAAALRSWEQASARLDEVGLLQLADAYRRCNRWAEALSIWRRLHRRGRTEASVALAKYFEHRRRNYRRALGYATHCPGEDGERRRDRLRIRLGQRVEEGRGQMTQLSLFDAGRVKAT
jgi:uncharacterized protein YprB with RNaseH-like and TPR domain